MRRLAALWRRLSGTAEPEAPATSALLTELRSAGLGESWLSDLAGRLYVDLPSDVVADLAARCPEEAAATRAAADRVLLHEFDLLGSGTFVPRDPDRPEAEGYAPIDWYLDPVSKLRFPRGIPIGEWDLYKMRPGLADIKLPWELARCQHFAPLGQAWRLTEDARYATEIVHEIRDFMAANPVGIGINWTCTMDVALRALNWALGLDLVQAALTDETRSETYAALYDHGVFIRGHFEDKYEVTSNHYLSNVVGLWYLAAVFEGLPAAAEWDTFCRTALEEEIQKQVLDDGADFESSLPYHRLVTELFLGSARLAAQRGKPFSDAYRTRLRAMIQVVLDVMRPDGLSPQVGDADDGRLHILTGYPDWQRMDARHLLAPAALLLDAPEWLTQVGPGALWEAAWWGFTVPDMVPEPPPPSFRLLPDAGLAIAREGDSYLAVTNAIVGTKGFGNHKHNDQLGFEYHVGGEPVLVDPGSYVYTSDPDARNLFRGTRSHNTIEIDGIEQNDTRPEWLFRMFESAKAEHLGFEATGEYVEYRGRHVGYTRLPEPVTHERVLRLLRGSGALLVLDRLIGTGTHTLRWHFHLAPGLLATVQERDILIAGQSEARLRLPSGLDVTVGTGSYSPGYGVRVPCATIDATCTVTLTGTPLSWRFEIGSAAWAASPERLDAVVRHHESMAIGSL